MKTDFFQHIAGLKLTGNLCINIQPQDDQLVVSVILLNDAVKDDAATKIPSMILRGDATDLDNGFFGNITAPLQRTNQLFCNLVEYEKAQSKADKENRIEKAKLSEQKKAKDSKQKKFDEMMKKVTDLENQKKFGEAIGQMPDLKTYPEFATEINHKMWQLRKQHGTLDMFAQEEPPAPLNTPETEATEEEPFDDNGDPEENEADDENDEEK